MLKQQSFSLKIDISHILLFLVKNRVEQHKERNDDHKL